jgi:hypothetical protein
MNGNTTKATLTDHLRKCAKALPPFEGRINTRVALETAASTIDAILQAFEAYYETPTEGRAAIIRSIAKHGSEWSKQNVI